MLWVQGESWCVMEYGHYQIITMSQTIHLNTRLTIDAPEEKLKIGVMTFWESQENYGQLLQAYAFQKYLKNKGHAPFLIRYNKAQSVKKHKPGFFQRLLKANWKKLLNAHALRKKLKVAFASPTVLPNRHFEEFKHAYLDFSPELYTSISHLQFSPPEADIYIAGSDQIWNYSFIGDHEPFFLRFGSADTLRIAYAASFGHKELPQEVKARFRRSLKNFDAVSVREHSGVTLCHEMGCEARVLPDPTVLLEKEDWYSLSREIPSFKNYNGKKIFVYTLGNRPSDAKGKLLEFVAALPNTKVAHVSVHKDSSGNAFPSIEEWLGYMKDCDLVITNSFHGMMLSTIFNKNFIGLPASGDKVGMNERLKTLVTAFNLQNHLLYAFDHQKVLEMMNQQVDWDVINRKIDSLRKEADQFLNFELLKGQVHQARLQAAPATGKWGVLNRHLAV